MVLTASVVYRHAFTHHSYGYSFSIRLLADCERLTTEEQLLQTQAVTHPGTNKTSSDTLTLQGPGSWTLNTILNLFLPL